MAKRSIDFPVCAFRKLLRVSRLARPGPCNVTCLVLAGYRTKEFDLHVFDSWATRRAITFLGVSISHSYRIFRTGPPLETRLLSWYQAALSQKCHAKWGEPRQIVN